MELISICLLVIVVHAEVVTVSVAVKSIAPAVTSSLRESFSIKFQHFFNSMRKRITTNLAGVFLGPVYLSQKIELLNTTIVVVKIWDFIPGEVMTFSHLLRSN